MTQRLLLLHTPLLGPYSLRALASELEQRDVQAETLAWPRLSSVAGDFYPTLAGSLAATIDGAGGGPVVLVAHSGAGALVPALAARLQTPVTGVVFLDAVLPHPGRSWFDTAPAEMRDQLRAGAQMGQLPPWDDWWPPGALARLAPDAEVRAALVAELEPLPLGYFEEPAPTIDLAAPAAYLQLSGGYEEEARLAGRMGWPVVRLPLNHLAPLTQPQAVAGALVALAERLAEPAHG
jgi:pimeloyl-ACP methyl ester carboxylesterase